ncbi:MAG: hypothetical protein HY690_12930 [Chloroflexi bacterium]|nr:hypothetical protein [Chloroflexota bacterium]
MIGIVAPILAFEEFVEVRGGRVERLCFHPAGQGVNVARAVRELGEECTVVAFNGGETGIVLRALLDAYGIAHRLVAVQGATAAIAAVTSNHAEQEVFRLDPPAVSRHEADDLYSAASLLVMECSVVALTTDLLEGMRPDFYARLIRLANGYQVLTVADVPPALLLAVAEARPTLVKPSLEQLRELYSLSERPAMEDLLAAADDLRAKGAGSVAISLGEGGAVVIDGDGAWQLVAPRVEAVVERGAGDCMVGGMLVGLQRRQPILEAVQLGAAAGCAKVMRHGLGTCKRDVTARLLPRVQVHRLR